MRLSFLQKLRSEKKETVATRQSQQKQKQNSQNIKQIGKQLPKKQFSEHHADLKKFLSILQEKRNPESSQNIPNFSQKIKEQEMEQNYQHLKQQKLRDHNLSNFTRRDYKSSQNKGDGLPKKFNELNNKPNSQQRVELNGKQMQIQGKKITQTHPSMFYCQFPAERKQFKGFLLVQQKKRQKQTLPKKSQKILHSQNGPRISQQKRGLQNMGNTCYINSIIQCLFHVPQFNQYFQKQIYQNEFINKRQNVGQGIIQKYRQLYLYVMKGVPGTKQRDRSTYSLKLALCNVYLISLAKKCSLFLDWQQEDAHQFMRKMLDSMHQQINRSQKNTPYRLLKTKTKLQHSSISSLADEYFQYYKQRDDSYIYDSLGGQIYNNVKCIHCQNQSISFENCLDVSLPIVKGKYKLQQLMREFFGEQRLCDYYRCEYCNQINKNSTKTTKFWRTPQILIIHFKRSQYGKKNQDPISFPVDVLNLQGCMVNQSNRTTQKHSNYTLRAIVCHKGVIEGGHYWAIVRQFGQWYEIDDQTVKKISHKSIKNQFEESSRSQPYILFYSSLNK